MNKTKISLTNFRKQTLILLALLLILVNSAFAESLEKIKEKSKQEQADVLSASTSEKSKWLSSFLYGNDNGDASLRKVTISAESDGYYIKIKNQFGFKCELQFNTLGQPQQLSNCLSTTDEDWYSLENKINLSCSTLSSEVVCKGNYTLVNSDYRSSSVITIARKQAFKIPMLRPVKVETGKEISKAKYTSKNFSDLQEEKNCSVQGAGPSFYSVGSPNFKLRVFEENDCTIKSINYSSDTVYIIDSSVNDVSLDVSHLIYYVGKKSVGDVLKELHLDLPIPYNAHYLNLEFNSIFGGQVGTDAGAGTFTSISMMTFNSTWNKSLVNQDDSFWRATSTKLKWKKKEFKKMFNESPSGFILMFTEHSYF